MPRRADGRYYPEPKRARITQALEELRRDSVLRPNREPQVCGVRYVRIDGRPTYCQRPVPCPDHPIPF